ncbi:MAG: hypothetical protein ACI8Y8_004003 [Planctomycetota bacterium]|jgi:hypothetical protein
MRVILLGLENRAHAASAQQVQDAVVADAFWELFVFRGRGHGGERDFRANGISCPGSNEDTESHHFYPLAQVSPNTG